MAAFGREGLLDQAPLHRPADQQGYVLEGDFYDQNQTYRVGDFIARQPGASHKAGSENGAVVLLFFG